jgi:hypothetical protein
MIEETTAWVLVLVLAGVLMLLVLAVIGSRSEKHSEPPDETEW